MAGGALIILFGLMNILNAKQKKHCLHQNIPLPQANTSMPVYVAKGFFVNILNVGVLAYWLTTTVTLRATLQDHPQEKSLIAAYFISTVAAYFATDVAKILAAQRLKKLLNEEFLIKVERVVGFVLIGFGLFLILRGWLNG